MKTFFNFFTPKRLLLPIVIWTLSMGACTKHFEKWNTNQHEATEEMLQYDNLSTGAFFVQMQSNVFPIAQQPAFGDEVYQVMQNLSGDVYSGYMGASNNWFSNANNTTYALIPQWYGQAFDRAFVGVMPAWYAIKQFAEEENPHVYAMATIIKVLALQRTTDMYGPLPYLNFGSGALQNDYDSEEAIYMAFFDELNAAIDVLSDFVVASPNVSVLQQYDFVYGGNVQNWVKFANSLKLRLAMRIVYANPTRAQQEAESAVNHPIGVITQSSEVAAFRQSSSFNFNHPLYIICFNFDDIRMGATMDSYLNGYNDPRRPMYFNTNSTGDYRGIRNGININNRQQYTGGSFSTLNVLPNTPIVWMNPAEPYFLRAEGALRGWNMEGNAQELYEEAISISFDYWGATGASSYIANTSDTPANYADPVTSSYSSPALGSTTIAWNSGGSSGFEANLERIITQKWIAMYPDGQEAWSEFRRTGYPRVFPVAVNNSGGTIGHGQHIRRLPFPSVEYQNNPRGVARGVAHLSGPDHAGTPLWWDRR